MKYKFLNGRIFQPVNHLIGEISLKESIFRTTHDTDGFVRFSKGEEGHKKIVVEWVNGITSILCVNHTIELDYRFEQSKNTIQYKVSEKALWCSDCGKKQPEKQPILPIGFWEDVVNKGAPDFFKREIDDILDEIKSSGMSYTKLFEKYNAHPWSSKVPNNLRDILHLFYDQVRAKQQEIDGRERKEAKKREKIWREQLPKSIEIWKDRNHIKSLDIHLINLFLFENEFEISLNESERKALLKQIRS